MLSWADKLIQEYRTGWQEVIRRADTIDRNNPIEREDLKHINRMIESMTFSLDWMKTGRQPGTYRGADKKAIYQQQYFESMDLIPDIQEQLQEMEAKQLYMTQEEKMLLSQIFGAMSLRERQCIILHVGQKMSMGLIAEEMGISKGTVQGYLKRAEKKVREIVA
ncbi:RNA polymerase sigma-70 factor (ECF subfamily) [Sporosarcina luteola]|nr:RNA polymerase sigma-70 factor (ECF subfamily) [Sporosarcina luteola]